MFTYKARHTLYMHVCMYVCMYTCILVVCIDTEPTHVQIQGKAYSIYACISTYVCTHSICRLHTEPAHARHTPYMHVSMYVNITHTYMYILIYTHTYSYTYIHTYRWRCCKWLQQRSNLLFSK